MTEENWSDPYEEKTDTGGSADPRDPAVVAMLQAGHGVIISAEHPFGRTSTERRVAGRFHKVRWALTYRQGILTPAQRQVLAIVYGCVMPPNKVAQRLGKSRQTVRATLRAAEAIVDAEYDRETRRARRFKAGRPDARLNDPDGLAWIEDEVASTLGTEAADCVRGPDAVRECRPAPDWLEADLRWMRAHERLRAMRGYTAKILRG
jgi:DNA-binding CsgD family transcriptional regulator